jgi:hypothetical protein
MDFSSRRDNERDLVWNTRIRMFMLQGFRASLKLSLVRGCHSLGLRWNLIFMKIFCNSWPWAVCLDSSRANYEGALVSETYCRTISMEYYSRLSHNMGTIGSTRILRQLIQNMLNISIIQTCKLSCQFKRRAWIVCCLISLHCIDNSILKMLLSVAPDLWDLPVDIFQLKTAHQVFNVDLVLLIKVIGTIQLLFPFTEYMSYVYRLLERSHKCNDCGRLSLKCEWNTSDVLQSKCSLFYDYSLRDWICLTLDRVHRELLGT